MKLTIEINLDNAAFDDAAEVRRLLALVSDLVESDNGDRGFYSPESGNLKDYNGNTCGSWTIED